MSKQSPSMDQWLKEAKAHESAPKVGMYLSHNGVACCFSSGREKNFLFIINPPLTEAVNHHYTPLTNFEKVSFQKKKTKRPAGKGGFPLSAGPLPLGRPVKACMARHAKWHSSKGLSFT